MIQRLQSIFLLGIIICMILLFVFPIWEKINSTNTKEKIMLNSYSLTKETNGSKELLQNTIYLAIIAFIIAAVATYELFSYKNRIFQRKLGAVNSLLLVLLFASTYYLIYTSNRIFDLTQDGTYQLGFFLIIISVVLNLLANRFILRDEKLVRSADRMRD